MSHFSPIGSGFRTAFRRPSLSLAEIAWRWSFAAAAWFLGTLFLIAYAGSLPVNALDRAMRHSGQPSLIGRALHRILAGSGLRFTATAVLLLLALTIGWIVLASLGRAAIVRAAAEELGIAANSRRTIRSLILLNFLRASTALAAVGAIAGVVLLASSLWAAHASLAQTGRMVMVVAFLIWLCWACLNWLLSFASIFAVTEAGLADGFGTAVRLLVQKTGTVVLIGVVFGICRIVLFLAACVAGVTELALIATALAPIAIVLAIATVAFYCALADFLHTSRAVAFLSLLRPEEAKTSERTFDIELSPNGGSVDKRELILSDLPAPAR